MKKYFPYIVILIIWNSLFVYLFSHQHLFDYTSIIYFYIDPLLMISILFLVGLAIFWIVFSIKTLQKSIEHISFEILVSFLIVLKIYFCHLELPRIESDYFLVTWVDIISQSHSLVDLFTTNKYFQLSIGNVYLIYFISLFTTDVIYVLKLISVFVQLIIIYISFRTFQFTENQKKIFVISALLLPSFWFATLFDGGFHLIGLLFSIISFQYFQHKKYQIGWFWSSLGLCFSPLVMLHILYQIFQRSKFDFKSVLSSSLALITPSLFAFLLGLDIKAAFLYNLSKYISTLDIRSICPSILVFFPGIETPFLILLSISSITILTLLLMIISKKQIFNQYPIVFFWMITIIFPLMMTQNQNSYFLYANFLSLVLFCSIYPVNILFIILPIITFSYYWTSISGIYLIDQFYSTLLIFILLYLILKKLYKTLELK